MQRILATLVVTVSALFDVQTVPLGPAQARVFLGQGPAEGVAAVFVLEGRELQAHARLEDGPGQRIALPEAASALDVADVDADSQGELIVIHGDRVLLYELFGETADGTSTELFRADTLLAGPTPEPFPHVMAVPHEEGIVLALPREDALELRDLAGELVAAYPFTREAGASHAVMIVPAPHPTQRRLDEPLESSVRFHFQSELQLPPVHDLPMASPYSLPRRATTRQARDAADLEPFLWPSFPLKTSEANDDDAHVLYAFSGADTLIQFRKPGAETAGVKRRYPGTLIATDDAVPDFNGDGYADLLLWRAPEPGVSVNSLTRTLAGGTWPVHVTAHLFAPEKGRYAPKPAAHVTCRVPIAWFFNPRDGVPLRHVVQDDFNGDGRTDVAFSTDARQFAAWLWRDTGFTTAPNFQKTFSQPIESFEFCADLDGDGRPAIALRAKTALFVLRPTGRREPYRQADVPPR